MWRWHVLAQGQGVCSEQSLSSFFLSTSNTAPPIHNNSHPFSLFSLTHGGPRSGDQWSQYSGHTGHTDSIQHWWYKCCQHSQVTEDNAKTSVLSAINSLHVILPNHPSLSNLVHNCTDEPVPIMQSTTTTTTIRQPQRPKYAAALQCGTTNRNLLLIRTTETIVIQKKATRPTDKTKFTFEACTQTCRLWY